MNNKRKILLDRKYKMIFNEKNLIMPEIYEFNHGSLNLTAIFSGVISEDLNGYITMRMDIADGKNSVGYIKVCSIPKETSEYLYPDELHWLCSYKNAPFNISKHPKKQDLDDQKEWKNKTFDEKCKSISSMYLHFSFQKHVEFQDRYKSNEEIDTEKEYNNLLKLAQNKYGEEFKKFKENCHLNLVDYSMIKNREYLKPEGEAIEKYCKLKNIDIKDFGESTSGDYTRKGIATEMYKRMADFLAQNDMVLRRGLTNKSSEALWNSFKTNKTINYVNENGFDIIDNRKEKLENNLKQKKVRIKRR